jgi:hypothetical protein
MMVCVLMMTDTEEDDKFHPTWYDKAITIILAPIIVPWFFYMHLTSDYSSLD